MYTVPIVNKYSIFMASIAWQFYSRIACFCTKNEMSHSEPNLLVPSARSMPQPCILTGSNMHTAIVRLSIYTIYIYTVLMYLVGLMESLRLSKIITLCCSRWRHWRASLLRSHIYIFFSLQWGKYPEKSDKHWTWRILLAGFPLQVEQSWRGRISS